MKRFIGYDAFNMFELAAKEGVYQLVNLALTPTDATPSCTSRNFIMLADEKVHDYDTAAMLFEATQLPTVQRDFVFKKAGVSADDVDQDLFGVYYPRLSRELLIAEYISRLKFALLASTGGK